MAPSNIPFVLTLRVESPRGEKLEAAYYSRPQAARPPCRDHLTSLRVAKVSWLVKCFLKKGHSIGASPSAQHPATIGKECIAAFKATGIKRKGRLSAKKREAKEL